MKLGIVIAALASAAVVSAQHHHAAPAAETPATLIPGLGTWTHPIATRNAEAQQYFNQGLILLYGFNRPEALRAFRKAAALDPSAPMAQWGIAMSVGPYINMDGDPQLNIKESCDAVSAGLRTPGIQPTDRAWLEAAQARCPDYSDPAKYVAAMRRLAAQYPDDPDAQTLLAEAIMVPVRWHWYDRGGKPADGMPEAERVLEGVLRRWPAHPGANHFYIHAVESSPTPERAVPCAQRLMGVVPAAGHMVHMPGHIWLVLGDYDNAVAVNERAADVDQLYFKKLGAPNSYYPYYLHNLHFILYARAMQGRMEDTIKAIGSMSEALKPAAQTMPEFAAIFGGVIVQTLLRMYRWDDVLAGPEPSAEDPMGMTMWKLCRGLALAGKGQLDEARAEQTGFETLRKKLDRNMQYSTNKLGDILDLASAVLAGRVAPSPAAALPHWKRAVELQDHLTYDEPPSWYYPVRESLGAAMLMAGDAAGAEATFRDGLRRTPNNGRMLFGLMESLKAQGKTDAARWVEREFETAWKGSDLKIRLKDL